MTCPAAMAIDHDTVRTLILILVVVSLAVTGEEAPLGTVYDIPWLDGIVIDGLAEDWEGDDRGFRVRILHHQAGRNDQAGAGLPAARDFDPRFRVGWDAAGLLLLVRVTDDSINQDISADQIWRGDGVELFVTDAVGGQDRFLAQLGPGRGPAAMGPRSHLQRLGGDPRPCIPLDLAVSPAPGGYLMEARFPWGNLGRSPETGQTLGCQLIVNDRDGERIRKALFYPVPLTHQDSLAAHCLRLADRASPPIDRQVRIWNEDFQRLRVGVYGESVLAGQAVVLSRFSQQELAVGELTEVDGRAECLLAVPLDREHPRFRVTVGGTACPARWPALQAERFQALVRAEVTARPAFFLGTTFPEVDFGQPERMRAALEDLHQEVVFFDQDYRPVTTAAHPGRYGAVVAFRWRGGTTRRYCTLHRLPGGVVAGEPTPADLLADRRWWIGFKRKGYQITTTLQQPRQEATAIAPVLRFAAPAAVDVDPTALATLETHCRRWAEEGGQPFSLCLVRKGVVILHAAYGTEDGRPVSLNRQYWLASISKLLSATVMLQAVDQGLVDLDQPLATVWPQFAVVPPGNEAMTLRHCYTHTAGFADHWGMGQLDLEDRLACLLPVLEPGRRWQYNGTSYELAASLVEMYADAPYTTVLRTHLLEPLGIASGLTCVDACGGDRGNALALAIVGQMLLNHGAYGTRRFFSEETFTAMLPRQLVGLAPDQGSRHHGIGTVWFRGEGLGDGAFGHGAASSSIFRILPEQQAVIALVRDGASWDYERFSRQFFVLVAAVLE